MNIEKIEINRHYVWVDKDAEIKIGDWITDRYKVWKWEDNCSLLGRKKIIAASPELNLEGVPAYVEWLAEQDFIKYGEQYQNVLFHNYKEIFVAGYQTAKKELPTWDDVRKAIYCAISKTGEGYNGEYAGENAPNIETEFRDVCEEIIEQLKQDKQ